MTRTLPTVGTITYDGFTFPAALHSSVTMRPIESSDGRNHKYAIVTIRVNCVLVASDLDSSQAPGTSLSGAFANSLTNLRKKLARSGKVLVANGIGFDITVGPANAIGFGPKPKIVQWDVIGANQAVNFTWEVEYTTVLCESESQGIYAEFTYSVGFSISEEGLTTRVVQGSYEVHSYRTGNNLVGSADSQWDSILLPRIPGFIRTHDHILSPDKRTVNFTITDREHPSDNPLYPGMLRMDIQQSIRNKVVLNGKTMTWDITISGSITVAPGVARSLAWLAFLIVFNDRFSRRSEAAGESTNDSKGVIAVTHLELTEDIFNRGVSFSVGYTLVTTLQTILAASGFGRPVPGNWSAWSASLEEFTGPRGTAGLRHYPSDDVIVDFCGGNPIPTPTQPVKRSPGYEIIGVDKNCPPEASSYYSYHWGLNKQSIADKVHYSTMGKRTQASGKISPGEAGDDSNPADDEQPSGSAPDSRRGSYSRGAGTIYVTIYGTALRIGYHVNIPKILTIGGVPVGEPIWQDIEASHVVGDAGGCKMYKASWRRTYLVRYEGTAVYENIPNQFKTPDLTSPNQ